MVAERCGISKQPVWKWCPRDDVHDPSHMPLKLQTSLILAQEAVELALRKALFLPPEDLLAVVRQFLNSHVSGSGLGRFLRPHGMGNLKTPKPMPAHKPFKAYESGQLHFDMEYLPQISD